MLFSYSKLAGAAEVLRNIVVDHHTGSLLPGFTPLVLAGGNPHSNALMAVAGPARTGGSGSGSLPPDVGLCAKCEAKNSKHASRCHACGDALPWSKPAKTQAAPQTAPKAPKPAADRDVQIHNFVVTAGEWAVIGGIGFVCFVIGLGGGLLSFLAYRYLSGTESKFANAVLAGIILHFAILGLVFFSGAQGAKP